MRHDRINDFITNFSRNSSFYNENSKWPERKNSLCGRVRPSYKGIDLKQKDLFFPRAKFLEIKEEKVYTDVIERFRDRCRLILGYKRSRVKEFDRCDVFSKLETAIFNQNSDVLKLPVSFIVRYCTFSNLPVRPCDRLFPKCLIFLPKRL